MKSRFNYFILLLYAIALSSCGNDDSPAPLNNEGKILSFSFMAADNEGLSDNVSATINEATKSIVATLPEGSNLSFLQPQFEVSEGASVNPLGPQDFTDAVYYTVVAEDGTPSIYTVNMKTTPRTDKQIMHFQFLLTQNPIQINIVAEIDHVNRKIFAVMPGITPLRALLPAVKVSEGATLEESGVQDFNDKVTYTVVAEDGSSNTYTVELATELDALKAIYRANPSSDLRLAWNIFDNDLESWPGVTMRHGAVVELSIGNEQISTIPPEIGLLRNLEDLGLQFNEFPSLPEEIGQLTNLRRLSAGINDELAYLPPTLGQLVQLERLHIDNAPSLMSLPVEIGNLTGLESLYINGNGHRTIPTEICELETIHGVSIYKDFDMTCE